MMLAVGPGIDDSGSTRRAMHPLRLGSSDDDSNDDDDDSLTIEDDNLDGSGVPNRPISRSGLAQNDDEASSPSSSSVSSSSSLSDDAVNASSNNIIATSGSLSGMRHDGCINCASWIEGWSLTRTSTTPLSYSNSFVEASGSEECPTQLMTSGDDKIVKIWDVSSAMGSDGNSWNWQESPQAQKLQNEGKLVSSTCSRDVKLVASVATGHRMNVFHVTTVPGNPGKIVTSAADGYLRLADVEIQALSEEGRAPSQPSTVIVSREDNDDDSNGFRMLAQSQMFFSHHFIDENTGLICTENRGLMRFDLRVSQQRQPGTLPLGMRFRTCKACALFPSEYGKWGESLYQSDWDHHHNTNYCFVGGAFCDVNMVDLRMVNVVQKYRPAHLGVDDSSVSVSGICVAQDCRELLVSYESDQIYTFPIFGKSSFYSDKAFLYDEAVSSPPLPELACYGGHLNRKTFLKSARYAGPNDEYICTGSDSGHAYVYEKSTGAVSAFLKADATTCNGVVSHPRLPFFVTYGIDSTAKLWRASIPADETVDDTFHGRSLVHRSKQYKNSPLVNDWNRIRKNLVKFQNLYEDPYEFAFPPDIMTTSGGNISDEDMFAHLRRGRDSRIANDYNNLPLELQNNFLLCARAHGRSSEEPVQSSLMAMARRISNMRLHHQFYCLGLPPHMKRKTFEKWEHSSDRVPDFPTDWLMLDNTFSSVPSPPGLDWNQSLYWEALRVTYVGNSKKIEGAYSTSKMERNVEFCNTEFIVYNNLIQEKGDGNGKNGAPDVDSSGEQFLKRLLDIVIVLKEGGNDAMRDGDTILALRRYDKAIRYCSVAYMNFPLGNLEFLEDRQVDLANNAGHDVCWGPLLKTLTACRLNLALAMSKPGSSRDRSGSIEQCYRALEELMPFASTKGKILVGCNLDDSIDADDTIYEEAKAFQAKAFFRLGCAQQENGSFPAAIESLQQCIKATKEVPDKEVDKVVHRRFIEAKKQNTKRKERHRKKFKFMFGADGNDKNNGTRSD